ncbi:hatching enzyme 1.2-like [Planococcus citri]|uniref:hatching enzyme 1.2-like n=1 Tax=Planococcus citri TaxID=170843 RepID=UPI0031F9BF05
MLILFALFLVSVVQVQCVPKHYFHLGAHLENPISSFQELINLKGGYNAGFQADGYRPRFRRCADHHVDVPFIISEGFSEKSRETILKSVEHFSKETCLKLREHKEEEEDEDTTGFYDGVVFVPLVNNASCESFHYTYVNATERLSLLGIYLNEPFCFNGTGRINRALYLSLGFISETLRPDRDDYVTVLWDNIKPDWKFKFQTRESVAFIPVLPYDYLSVSHYYPNEFAEEGKLSLISKTENHPLQWNTELSALDKYRINSVLCGKRMRDQSDESSSTDVDDDDYEY